MNDPLLKIENITKKFKNFVAVDQLSFSVNKGDIYGFLGPNGAGKSTTLRMILGLISPTNGTISIKQTNINTLNKSYLKSIGALIEKPDFYTNLSAYQNLKILAKMSGIKDPNILDNLLKEVGLLERKNDKVKAFSQGMKQRLGIAQTLLHDPDLIILDEPSNGLDPQGQADMRNLILSINQKRKITIIISSHILSEIEKICNRMVVINKGKKVIEGEVKNLMKSEQLKISLKTEDVNKMSKFLNSKKIEFETFDNNFTIHCKEDNINNLIHSISSEKINLQEVKQLRTLEEYFLDITK